MKNTIKILGIIALVTIIGFALISCEEPEDNPFVGTWEGSITALGGAVELVITETTWEIKAEGVKVVSGTYKYEGSTATLTGSMTVGGAEVPQNGTATVNGDKMTVKIGVQPESEFTRK